MEDLFQSSGDRQCRLDDLGQCLTMPRPIVPPKGYPVAPRSLGEHLRKKRLDLGLLQAQVAEKIGVTESTVWNWEHGVTPALQHHSKIIQFLGYQPDR